MSVYQYISKEKFQKIKNPQVTSVHAFIKKNDDFLFTINPRGIDIIGGHMEKEENPEEAIIREAKEEASIDCFKMEILGAIEIDNTLNQIALKQGYPRIGYQLFFYVIDYQLNEFQKSHECIDRVWIKKNDIIKKHHNWMSCHQDLINLIGKQNSKRMKK